MAILADFGQIKGSVTAKGFENHIQLHAAIVSAGRTYPWSWEAAWTGRRNPLHSKP